MPGAVLSPTNRLGRPRAPAIPWRAVVMGLLLGLAGLAPAWADSEMKQSPLLMRRAGPSCQPGNLGAETGAGYNYRLGPCEGPDTSDAVPALESLGQRRGRRR